MVWQPKVYNMNRTICAIRFIEYPEYPTTLDKQGSLF